MKEYAHNPMFLITNAILPWRLAQTFIEMEEDYLTLSRYFAQGGEVNRRVDVVEYEKVKSIGWSSELGIKGIEERYTGRYGSYYAQELIFVTEDNVVSWNVRPYTKGQVRMVINKIREQNHKCTVGTKLNRALY